MAPPDKLYIAAQTFPNEIDWEGSPINTTKIENTDVEYIRKDTFLKWLETEIKYLAWYKEKMGHVTGSVGNNETSGKIEECQKFIDKINSL